MNGDDLRELFHIGDMIEIAGLYADGTREKNETPRSEYQIKPLKKWRVAGFLDRRGVLSVRLHPLNEDGTIDEFNEAFGDFWIQ